MIVLNGQKIIQHLEKQNAQLKTQPQNFPWDSFLTMEKYFLCGLPFQAFHLSRLLSKFLQMETCSLNQEYSYIEWNVNLPEC